jgi:hypothetical protein
LIALAACSGGGAVVLHPITERDIVMLDAGDTFVAPASGAFLSDFYIKEVMKARVGR